MLTTVETVRNELVSRCKEHQIKRSTSIALAFSGGSDSLALLLACHWYFKSGALKVFYVNHHLRSIAELEREIALNQQNCERLGLSLEVLDLGIDTVNRHAIVRGKGVEEAARFLRYQALNDACKKASVSVLATAHNADDQLETLLMRLFQSSSIEALGGIASYQKSKSGFILFRPLVRLPHSVLRSSVEAQGFVWAHDASNDEDQFLRNKIRHALKPALLSIFPEAFSAVQTANRRFSELAILLEDIVDDALSQVTFVHGDAQFSLPWFVSLNPIIQENVLFRIFGLLADTERNRIRTAMFQHFCRTLTLSRMAERWVLETSGTRMSLRANGIVHWQNIIPIQHFCIPLENPAKVQTIHLANDVDFCIYSEDPTADSSLLRVDANQLEDPVIRSPLAQDTISLNSGTVLVTKLLSQYKVPRYLYPSIPLLCDRSGVVAIFARFLGGRDRLASRFKAPLAHRLTNIYSSNKRNEYSEI